MARHDVRQIEIEQVYREDDSGITVPLRWLVFFRDVFGKLSLSFLAVIWSAARAFFKSSVVPDEPDCGLIRTTLAFAGGLEPEAGALGFTT